MARIETAGVYQVKPFDWAVKDGRDNTTDINVILEHVDDGRTITYFGTLGKSEKGDQFTLKNLITLGLSTTDLSSLAEGRIGGALDVDKVVEITVEEYQKNAGGTGLKVQWINELGGHQKFQGAMDRAQAKGKLSAFAGKLAKLQHEMGAKKREEPPPF